MVDTGDMLEEEATTPTAAHGVCTAASAPVPWSDALPTHVHITSRY